MARRISQHLSCSSVADGRATRASAKVIVVASRCPLCASAACSLSSLPRALSVSKGRNTSKRGKRCCLPSGCRDRSASSAGGFARRSSLCCLRFTSMACMTSWMSLISNALLAYWSVGSASAASKAVTCAMPSRVDMCTSSRGLVSTSKRARSSLHLDSRWPRKQSSQLVHAAGMRPAESLKTSHTKAVGSALED